MVVVAFAFEILESHPQGSEISKHLFVPGFAGTESILLATGIIGATVMPHVIYLHSALTQRRIVGRDDRERRQILRFERVDVVIAMAIAGAVNLSMMIMAAALFHGSGLVGIDSIDGAFDGLKQLVSPGAATIFGIALLASGYASSSVGTMAGQVVMQGFIRRQDPDLPAPRDHADPGVDRARRGPGSHGRAGRQPGRALLRHPVRARPAGVARSPEGPDGLARQSSVAHSARLEFSRR